MDKVLICLFVQTQCRHVTDIQTRDDSKDRAYVLRRAGNNNNNNNNNTYTLVFSVSFLVSFFSFSHKPLGNIPTESKKNNNSWRSPDSHRPCSDYALSPSAQTKLGLAACCILPHDS